MQFSDMMASLPKLPEGDGSGSGYVQGVDTMCHRNADHLVGFRDGLLRQPVTLGPHDDSQTRLFS